ncbi:hypothetical protein MCEREM21A_02642 [Sphingomonadaceae bacterium]
MRRRSPDNKLLTRQKIDRGGPQGTALFHDIQSPHRPFVVSGLQIPALTALKADRRQFAAVIGPGINTDP